MPRSAGGARGRRISPPLAPVERSFYRMTNVCVVLLLASFDSSIWFCLSAVTTTTCVPRLGRHGTDTVVDPPAGSAGVLTTPRTDPSSTNSVLEVPAAVLPALTTVAAKVVEVLVIDVTCRSGWPTAPAPENT